MQVRGMVPPGTARPWDGGRSVLGATVLGPATTPISASQAPGLQGEVPRDRTPKWKTQGWGASSPPAYGQPPV